MSSGRLSVLALLTLLVLLSSFAVAFGHPTLSAAYDPGLYASVLEGAGGASRIASAWMEQALKKVLIGAEFRNALISATEGTFMPESLDPVLKYATASLKAYLSGSSRTAGTLGIDVELWELKRVFLSEFSKHYRSTDYLKTLLDQIPSRVNVAEYIGLDSLSAATTHYRRATEIVRYSAVVGLSAAFLLMLVAPDHRRGIRWIGCSVVVGGLICLGLSFILPSLVIDKVAEGRLPVGFDPHAVSFDLEGAKDAAAAFLAARTKTASLAALALGAAFLLLGRGSGPSRPT